MALPDVIGILLLVFVRAVTGLKLGLLFPMMNSTSGPQWAVGALMAINDINSRRTDIIGSLGWLPSGFYVDYVLNDSSTTQAATFAGLWQIQNGVSGVVGPSLDTQCSPVSLIALVFSTPLVSYSCASSTLTGSLYPTFHRVIAPEVGQAEALARMVVYFSWTRVAVISSDDASSTDITRSLTQWCNELGIIVVAGGVVTSSNNVSDAQVVLTAAKKQGVRVVLLVTAGAIGGVVMENAYDLGLTGAGYAWLATSDALQPGNFQSTKAKSAAQGLVGTDTFDGEGSVAYSHFLARWNSSTASQFPTVPGLQDAAFLGPPSPTTILAYDAVIAMVTAAAWADVQNNTMAPAAIDQTMDKSSFSFPGIGSSILYQNQSWARFAVRNYWDGALTTVGKATTGVPFVLPTMGSGFAAIRWPGDSATPPTDRPFAIVASWAVTVCYTLGGVAMATTACFMAGVWWFRTAPPVRAGSPSLLVLLLLFLIMGFVNVFLWTGSSDTLCMVYPYTVGIPYSAVFGILFVKTWRLIRIFHSKEFKSMPMRDSQLMKVVFGVVVLECMLNVAWSILDPPKLQLHLQQHTESSEFYRACGSDSGRYFVWLAISGALKGLYLLYGCYLSFKARNLKDEFNESRAIGFIVYNTVIFFLVFGLASFILGMENPTLKYMLITGWLLCWELQTLFVLFIPKFFALRNLPSRGAARTQANPAAMSSAAMSSDPNFSTRPAPPGRAPPPVPKPQLQLAMRGPKPSNPVRESEPPPPPPLDMSFDDDDGDEEEEEEVVIPLPTSPTSSSAAAAATAAKSSSSSSSIPPTSPRHVQLVSAVTLRDQLRREIEHLRAALSELQLSLPGHTMSFSTARPAAVKPGRGSRNNSTSSKSNSKSKSKSKSRDGSRHQHIDDDPANMSVAATAVAI